MTTKQQRDKMLRMFPEGSRSNVQPILDSIIKSAAGDGVLEGRKQAAAMLEQLILGDADLDMAKLRDLKDTLIDGVSR